MQTGLAQRTVLVTGASGGIGQEIARAFAAEQARVVLHCHTHRDGAEKLQAELGAPSIVVQADLTAEADVASMFAEIQNRFGPVAHIVCNAGYWPPQNVPIRDMSLEQWQATVDVDLTSVFLCCREFLRGQLASVPDPSIVLIGSTAGVFGEAGHGDYAAAKSALLCGLMNSLKNEIVQIAARGRVNTVSPGWVMTPMTTKFADDPGAVNKALATIALNKVAAPLDIANAVVFLSSPDLAGHITGQNLVVSGGMEGRLLNPPGSGVDS